MNNNFTILENVKANPILRMNSRYLNINYNIKFESFLALLQAFGLNEKEKYEQISKYVEILNSRNREIVKSLKVSHKEKIRQLLKEIQSKSYEKGKKTELEQLFFDCVLEVKKSIVNNSVSIQNEISPELKPKHKIKILELLFSKKEMLMHIYNLIFSGNYNDFNTQLNANNDFSDTPFITKSTSKQVKLEKSNSIDFHQNHFKSKKRVLHKNNSILIQDGKLVLSDSKEGKLKFKIHNTQSIDEQNNY